MLEPARVADCVAAMRAVVSIPVTVKMRVGVITAKGRAAHEAVEKFDDEDFEALHEFVRSIRDAGCQVAIVHARKAVLGGLSPKDNREIPPLRYDVVKRLRLAFPELQLIVNGGFRDVARREGCVELVRRRDARSRGLSPPLRARGAPPRAVPRRRDRHAHREEMLDRMARYAERALARGDRLSAIARHMLGSTAASPARASIAVR